MKIFLNNTPCQFTNSKTTRAIDYIHAAMATRCKPNSENGIHNITIIVNNNSLLDSRQWNNCKCFSNRKLKQYS